MKLFFSQFQLHQILGIRFCSSYIHTKTKSMLLSGFLVYQSAPFYTTNILLLVTCKSNDPTFFTIIIIIISINFNIRARFPFIFEKLGAKSTLRLSSSFLILFSSRHYWFNFSCICYFLFCLPSLDIFCCLSLFSS